MERAGGGIGMQNVAERLNVLYGTNAKMQISSKRDRGTKITLELPLVQTNSDNPSAASAIYEARSNTRA
jgi:two-component system, LytTR family, sensor kinase